MSGKKTSHKICHCCRVSIVSWQLATLIYIIISSLTLESPVFFSSPSLALLLWISCMPTPFYKTFPLAQFNSIVYLPPFVIEFYSTYMIITHRISIGNNFKWVLVALREIKITDDVYCECEECTDIHDYYECIRTSPCPDSNINTSFCYWKPFHDHQLTGSLDQSVSAGLSSVPPELWGYCDCCKYTQCEPGQYFNRQLCKCLCHSIPCPFPRVQDPDTCECVCPQKHDYGPLQNWDPCQCQCECSWFLCKPPRYPDYESCECQCPPSILCEPPFEQDLISCECQCP